MGKGQALLRELEALTSTAAVARRIHLYPCDLADLSQVRRFLAEFKAASDRLDLLISTRARMTRTVPVSSGVDNAGNYSARFVRSPDGVESQLAVHVLAAYLLARDLRLSLSRSRGRIINVNSSMHLATHRFSLDCFKDERAFGRFSGYCQAKYAQLLLTRQLVMDWRSAAGGDGTDPSSPPPLLVVVHPGGVRTEIARDDPLADRIFSGPLQWFPWLQLTASQGALTLAWAALGSAKEFPPGAYLHDLGADEPVSVHIKEDLEAGRGKLLLAFCDVLVRAE